MTATPPSDPLPTFTSLDLTLSRDQGTLHSSFGAGSEAQSLSHVAATNHDKIAHRIISQSSASHALSPDNLPQAPKDLLLSPALSAIAIEGFDSASSSAANSGSSTPTGTGTHTPALVPEPSSTSATAGSSRVSTPSSFPMVAPGNTSQGSFATTAGSKSASSNGTTATKSSKSVFGKLFERSNASTSSVSTGGGGSVGEKMERGESSNSGSANGTTGGAALARKTSKKETEKAEKERLKVEKERLKAEEKEREKEEKLLRVPSSAKRTTSQDGRKRSESSVSVNSGSNGDASQSRPRAPSHGEKEKDNGMGAALNEFMRNKVSRKSSVTSKRSDDGRSDKGSEKDGHSGYGGSDAGKSSLTKKYGVCEKIAIGKGATATVKLAHKWDRTTERLYAVKEFRKRRKNETEKEYVKKLTSEFCISSTLHHHNIVETVDLVQDEQSHWCEVMEYCPGGDLYAAIKKGNLSSDCINSYFKQILAGVSYLHSMGVAHRDIKPENLLLDAKGHVKITDFGVSDVFRMCWEKTTHLSKGLCGSEPYIAPEQFEQKEYDARLVDVWACAVVFYCMHFQELPWRVAKPSDPSYGPYMQLYNGTASPPPLSNLVPRECRAIIRRMLDPNPKTRATTESILADPWFSAIVVTPPEDHVIVTPLATPNLNGGTSP